MVGKWPPPNFRAVRFPVFSSHKWLLIPNGFLFSRDFQKLKFLRFSKISRTFNVVDVFLTSLYVPFLPNRKFFLSDSLPVFILVINKSDFHYAVVDFVITRMITDRIWLHSVLSPLLHKKN